MLKKFEIFGLFGLYDYVINWDTSEENGLLFLTGPNGMGKTTILRLIRALFNRDFDYICNTPYKTIRYSFDQNAFLEFERKSIYPDVVKESDANVVPELLIDFTFKSNVKFDRVRLHQENGHWIVPLSQLPMANLLIESTICRLLSDDRLIENMKDNDATEDPKLLMKFFEGLADKFLANYKLTFESERFSKIDVNKRIKKVLGDVGDLKRWGIEVPVDTEALSSQNGLWGDTLSCCENALDICKDEIELLRTFEKFIANSGLMNKDVLLSRTNGYRVYAHDDVRTILPFTSLSSGEKQMICQIYSLLFKFESHSIVLIDEPELSYHMMWQMQYLDVVQVVTKLRKMHLLIATHSPQMFSGRFDLTTDLYRQYRNKSKKLVK